MTLKEWLRTAPSRTEYNLFVLVGIICLLALLYARYSLDQWYLRHSIRNAVRALQDEGTIPKAKSYLHSCP